MYQCSVIKHFPEMLEGTDFMHMTSVAKAAQDGRVLRYDRGQKRTMYILWNWKIRQKKLYFVVLLFQNQLLKIGKISPSKRNRDQERSAQFTKVILTWVLLLGKSSPCT